MFDDKQISFMQSLGLGFDFDNLSDDNLVQIEDFVAEKLQISGFDTHYNLTDIGKMCESILDKLS